MKRKVFRIGTVRYNWPMSAHASQAFSIPHYTVFGRYAHEEMQSNDRTTARQSLKWLVTDIFILPLVIIWLIL